MRKPAQVDGLVPDLRTDRLTGDYQVLHIQVIGRPNAAARRLVLGKQQRTRLERKIDQSTLFVRLPNGGCLKCPVG